MATLATDNVTLEQKMEKLSLDLKLATSALNDLSIQLKGIQLGQQAVKDGVTLPKPDDDKQPQRTCGYINWNTTHDILKTESWKKMSVFTDFCGRIERGGIPNFYSYIEMDDKKTVDEETRFPEDDLYVNVNNPLVRTEILYIKELRASKPVVGLVERFLSVAKDEMHTFSSFEKKYGLKWINPLPESNTVIENESEPIVDIPVSSATIENPIVHSVVTDSWCLKDTKLEEVDSEGTPTNDFSVEELVLQELSEKFTYILENICVLNLDNSLKKVMKLPIDDQKRLQVTVDLLFEKALEKPNSSLVYANLAKELSRLKVPSGSDPNSYVNFRMRIIQKCQDQFESDLHKELADTNDFDTEEKLEMKNNGRNTTERNRSVALAKFIGELYKVKFLTYKIVEYCLKNLSNKLEEDKIECLCELLATAGQQLEREANLDNIFLDMQDMIDFKSDQISSSAQFMIQDLIDLRNRKWVKATKNIVMAFPKTLDEIQKESDQRALLIQLMKTFDVGDIGGSGDGSACIRRKEDESSKHAGRYSYTVEFLKLQAISEEIQNYIKLPPKSFDNFNMFYFLEKIQTDPTTRGNTLDADPCATPTYHSNITSIEERLNFTGACPQAPITDLKMKSTVKLTIEEYLINEDKDDVVADVKQLFPPQYQAALINEILNVALDKTSIEISKITNLLLHLVATNTIVSKNFAAGLEETLTFAPDLFIDIPKLYDYLGTILAPHIKHNHIAFAKIFELSETIVFAKQGHLFLKSIFENIVGYAGGLEYLSSNWQESGLQLSQWMCKNLVSEWIDTNNFKFLLNNDFAKLPSGSIPTRMNYYI